MPNPSGSFLADPFIFNHESRTFIFAEEYNYKRGLGHITVIDIDGQSVNSISSAIEENFHLSFPFVFEFEGDIFMCPESSQINEIRLYKATKFPLEWEHSHTLLSAVSAADTILFRSEDRWWMLTNICSAKMNDHCSELHAFYADSPLSADWTPHKNNPIIFSSNNARNGGLILDGDRVYRVFQRQGWDFYGESFGVAEILSICENGYEEKIIFTVDRRAGKSALGTHSLSHTNGYVAFDSAKRSSI